MRKRTSASTPATSMLSSLLMLVLTLMLLANRGSGTEKYVETLDFHHHVACIIRHPHIFALVHVWFYAYHCLFACMAPSGLLASESFFFLFLRPHSFHCILAKDGTEETIAASLLSFTPLLLFTIMFSPIPNKKKKTKKKTPCLKHSPLPPQKPASIISTSTIPTLINASLIFNTTASNYFQLSLQLVVTDISQSEASNPSTWQYLQLREAWLAPIPLQYTTNINVPKLSIISTLANNTFIIQLNLNSSVYRTTSKPVDYSLYCFNDSFTSNPGACDTSDTANYYSVSKFYVNTSTAIDETPFLQLRPAITCRSFRGVVTNIFQLNSTLDVMEFA